jgi:hypothetical protein
MRRTLISSLLLFLSSSLWAADHPDNRWRLSIMASEISSPTSEFAGFTPDDVHAGVSVGVAYAPTAQWDVELTAASQTHVSPYTRLLLSPSVGDGIGLVYPATEFRRYRVTPFDVSVTRHFRTGQTIAPYVRAGVRYVGAPDDPSMPNFPQPYVIPGNLIFIPVTEGYGLRDRLSTQAGAGVRVRLTPRTAVRPQIHRLLRDEDADFDPLTRYAVGLSWLF